MMSDWQIFIILEIFYPSSPYYQKKIIDKNFQEVENSPLYAVLTIFYQLIFSKKSSLVKHNLTCAPDTMLSFWSTERTDGLTNPCPYHLSSHSWGSNNKYPHNPVTNCSIYYCTFHYTLNFWITNNQNTTLDF